MQDKKKRVSELSARCMVFADIDVNVNYYGYENLKKKKKMNKKYNASFVNKSLINFIKSDQL